MRQAHPAPLTPFVDDVRRDPKQVALCVCDRNIIAVSQKSEKHLLCEVIHFRGRPAVLAAIQCRIGRCQRRNHSISRARPLTSATNAAFCSCASERLDKQIPESSSISEPPC